MEREVTEALEKTNFGIADGAIVVVYLAISVAIGFVVRRYVNNMTTYIGAGRKVGTWLGVATMTGTEMGLITLMYSAQKGFTGGFAAFHIAVIAGAVTLLVGLSGFIVVPLRELKVLTIPEYYEKRFDRKTRVLGGIMLAFGGILNMGLFLKVGSMFIVGVTGLSSTGWALPLVMLALLVLVLVYTTMGGMISVVLTDYLQFVVLSVGLLVATVLAINQLGWNEVFVSVESIMGDKGFNPVAEGSGFGWSYVFWMATLGLVSCAVWPTAIARALAMESPAAVKRQFMWSSISFTVRFMIPYFWGICALVYIHSTTDGADLKALFFPAEGSEREAVSNLYAMPIYMGRLLPTIILGVMTAAMIAAFMSTHDSYFLCWSSVITQDIVAPLRKKKPLTGTQRVKLTRWLIVLIGGYVLYWGLFYEGKDDIWDYMAVSGAIYFTGALAVLICGLYWKGASSAGAFAALLTGLIALLGLGPVQQVVGLQYKDDAGEWVQRVTGAQIGLLSVALAFVVMIVVSLRWPDSSEERTEKGERE